MWDYDDCENPPDVLLDMPYETETYTDTIFADSHFYIEMENIQAVQCSRSYSQHFQGYMALTPKGVELAEQFFSRIAQVIANHDEPLGQLFQREYLAWVAAPMTGLPHYMQATTGVYSTDGATWTRTDAHPFFTSIFWFKFPVTMSSRHTGERRVTWPFYRINGEREQTVQMYAEVLRHSPNTFLRPPVPVAPPHDPILAPDEIQLLANFKWDRHN
jgi:hypothetical protein